MSNVRWRQVVVSYSDRACRQKDEERVQRRFTIDTRQADVAARSSTNCPTAAKTLMWVKFTDERQSIAARAVVHSICLPRPQADAALRGRVRWFTGRPRYMRTGMAVRGTVPVVDRHHSSTVEPGGDGGG